MIIHTFNFKGNNLIGVIKLYKCSKCGQEFEDDELLVKRNKKRKSGLALTALKMKKTSIGLNYMRQYAR